MIVAKVKITGVSPYQPSRKHNSEKLEKESFDEYEKRTWRERAHCDEDGNVYIPPMAFKQAVDAAIKYLGTQVPGRGKTTYTKHFGSGVLFTEPMMIGVKKDELMSEKHYCNADGVRGSGKRVDRTFPVIRKWGGEITVMVLDPIINREIFRKAIVSAGQFIGIGRFRPQNQGFYGRFKAEVVSWTDAK